MQFDLFGTSRSPLSALAGLSLVLAVAGCDQESGKQPEPSASQAPAEPAGSLKAASAGTNLPENADSANPAIDKPALTATGDGDLVGRVSRQMIEEQRQDWHKAIEEASPDEKDARALASVAPGAEVTIYLGAWCEDCQREVPRFLKALDIAGEVPFSYELIGVDKYFRADEVSVDPLEIPAVPYFVVERDGQNVGQIVEKPSETIERDLLTMLRGK